MSSNQSSSKPRLQRLRASCDGCFSAKVKCSKSRPICSRCLACGIDCKYSPSSRAGKPRADARRASQPNIHLAIGADDRMRDETISPQYVYTSHAMSTGSDGQESPLFNLDTNWSTPSCSTDVSRQSMSSSNTPLIPDENSIDAEAFSIQASGADLFDPAISWTPDPHNNMSHNARGDSNLYLSRSKSLPQVPLQSSLAPWFDGQNNFLSFTNDAGIDSTTPSNAFMADPFNSHVDALPKQFTGSCNCFSNCLEALQALHSHSSSSQVIPPFDVVLTVNRKAVECCAMMISCNCMINTGSNTATMLLATILSKIMSFYRAAAQSYFGFTPGPKGQSQPLPLMYGSYQVASEDGRWLEMEILWRELRKLEELFGRFQDICNGAVGTMGNVEEGGVHTALTNHLGQELSFTFEVLKLQETTYRNVE